MTRDVAGFDVVSQPAQVRRHIGVTFQEVVLDQDLTGRQVLDFHGQLYGLNGAERRSRITDLADLVELSDVLDRKASGYSGGMKRRLELAWGLMTQPAVLFLDEPTQGLDPQNRAGIWTYIRRLRDEGGLTLLLTTHYMEEAEALAEPRGDYRPRAIGCGRDACGACTPYGRRCRIHNRERWSRCVCEPHGKPGLCGDSHPPRVR